jgi:hypothetical protein
MLGHILLNGPRCAAQCFSLESASVLAEFGFSLAGSVNYEYYVVLALVPDLSVFDVTYKMTTKKKKLRGLSPQAHYTDRATAACQRSL